MKNKLVPAACFGVKCMQKGCSEFAEHKVAEVNLWRADLQSEKEMHNQKAKSHELTTYLCKEHFDALMNRDVQYYKNDPRFSADDERVQ